jgi:MinD-like ATPase involved in chromosome partitioning or flagellar assembly
VDNNNKEVVNKVKEGNNKVVKVKECKVVDKGVNNLPIEVIPNNKTVKAKARAKQAVKVDNNKEVNPIKVVKVDKTTNKGTKVPNNSLNQVKVKVKVKAIKIRATAAIS